MIDTVLIANRGEIACRIMRTARALGMRTVAVYSDADAGARHVREADVALRLGPAPARESYLNIEAVLDAARRADADAVHPGYGFLSENAEFAEACERAGLTFVGPSAAAIRAMGSKIEAKRLVADAGAPVVPGYQGDDQSDDRLAAEADALGYPLLIKASAGGGGKGMRRVDGSAAFASALAAARREAAAAFGDDRVLLERYLTAPKHLEVQILADGQGRVLHLFERDCSVQRRHQKVIEEAPGATVSEALRADLGEAAVQAARSIDYRGAGTVEFIAEGERFYFMEMNTRLQVEHPVTEAITGIDLVAWQLRIAAGEALTLEQHDIGCSGHAVEARIYAENPRRGFLPSTGRLLHVAFAEDVRVDAGVETGDAVTVHYDPMLAKIIAHGEDRADAIARLDRALAATEIAGVEHNLAFLRAVLGHTDFRSGSYTTHLLDADEALAAADRGAAGLVCAALVVRAARLGGGRWSRGDGFRLNQAAEFRLRLRRDETEYRLCLGDGFVEIDAERLALVSVAVDANRVRCVLAGEVVQARWLLAGENVYVMRGGDTERVALWQPDVAALGATAAAGDRVAAPMPGQVISVSVRPGDPVAAGQVLAVIEAMKMEHAVSAPRDGVVADVACAVGDRVDDGFELITLEPL
jgi:3-methylcrotonyl-CoA carboxylase alpha subunit